MPHPLTPVPARPGRPETSRPRPDATPMRFALGIGGLATLSAIATAIVAPVAAGSVLAGPVAQGTQQNPGTGGPAATSIAVKRPVVYVQLRPGQTPPPGAKVIQAAAPKPVTIVTTIAAPAQRSVVVRTTQSGKVIP